MFLLLYQMFLSISSHSQRSVGDLIHLVLVWFKGHEESGAPLLALDDRSDAAALVCGVEDRKALSVRASHRTNKMHRLQKERRRKEGRTIIKE